jgi:hypothetical protein
MADPSSLPDRAAGNLKRFIGFSSVYSAYSAVFKPTGLMTLLAKNGTAEYAEYTQTDGANQRNSQNRANRNRPAAIFSPEIHAERG